MITMTWAEINKPAFVNAIFALDRSDKLDRVTAYRAGRIAQMIRQELGKKAFDAEIKLATELAERDDKGEIVMVDTPQGKRPKVHADNLDQMKKRMDDLFAAQSVSLKVHKLDFNQLQDLTGEQLIAIEHILENVPDEE